MFCFDVESVFILIVALLESRMKIAAGKIVNFAFDDTQHTQKLLELLLIVVIASLVDSCVKPCPKIFALICAKLTTNENQKQTFENSCLMENWNCQNPKQQYMYDYDGECKTAGGSGPVKFAKI